MSLSSGKLTFRDGHIEYAAPPTFQMTWRVRIDDIRVIGEFTNEDFPADDWFFAFLTQKRWYECPVYADGFLEALKSIREHLDFEFQIDLACSTTFKSCVWWPKRLQSEDLFHFTPVRESAGLLGRLWQRRSPRMQMQFTEAVLKEIDGSE